MSLQRQSLVFGLDWTSLASHIAIDSNLLFRPIPKADLVNINFQMFEATLAFIYDSPLLSLKP